MSNTTSGKKSKRTRQEIRVEAAEKLKEKLDLIVQQQSCDGIFGPAYYHRILIAKMPYASRCQDWFGCRSEWVLIGFVNWGNDEEDDEGDDEVILLPCEKYPELTKPTVIDLKTLQSEFFEFSNMSISDKLKFPHYNDWWHCTCTHIIHKVFIVWNKITKNITRIGSECIEQFADVDLLQEALKVKKFASCHTCKCLFLDQELQRVFPGKKTKIRGTDAYKSMKVIECTQNRHKCYTCSVPKRLSPYVRCSQCCNLIKKGQERCLDRCYYDDIL